MFEWHFYSMIMVIPYTDTMRYIALVPGQRFSRLERPRDLHPKTCEIANRWSENQFCYRNRIKSWHVENVSSLFLFTHLHAHNSPHLKNMWHRVVRSTLKSVGVEIFRDRWRRTLRGKRWTRRRILLGCRRGRRTRVRCLFTWQGEIALYLIR